MDGFPFPETDSSHGFSIGYAELGEAVHEGDTDLARQIDGRSPPWSSGGPAVSHKAFW